MGAVVWVLGFAAFSQLQVNMDMTKALVNIITVELGYNGHPRARRNRWPANSG